MAPKRKKPEPAEEQGEDEEVVVVQSDEDYDPQTDHDGPPPRKKAKRKVAAPRTPKKPKRLNEARPVDNTLPPPPVFDGNLTPQEVMALEEGFRVPLPDPETDPRLKDSLVFLGRFHFPVESADGVTPMNELAQGFLGTGTYCNLADKAPLPGTWELPLPVPWKQAPAAVQGRRDGSWTMVPTNDLGRIKFSPTAPEPGPLVLPVYDGPDKPAEDRRAQYRRAVAEAAGEGYNIALWTREGLGRIEMRNNQGYRVIDVLAKVRQHVPRLEARRSVLVTQKCFQWPDSRDMKPLAKKMVFVPPAVIQEVDMTRAGDICAVTALCEGRAVLPAVFVRGSPMDAFDRISSLLEDQEDQAELRAAMGRMEGGFAGSGDAPYLGTFSYVEYEFEAPKELAEKLAQSLLNATGILPHGQAAPQRNAEEDPAADVTAEEEATLRQNAHANDHYDRAFRSYMQTCKRLETEHKKAVARYETSGALAALDALHLLRDFHQPHLVAAPVAGAFSCSDLGSLLRLKASLEPTAGHPTKGILTLKVYGQALRIDPLEAARQSLDDPKKLVEALLPPYQTLLLHQQSFSVVDSTFEDYVKDLAGRAPESGAGAVVKAIAISGGIGAGIQRGPDATRAPSSLADLLKSLESPASHPEAPQPAGLAVDMRGYQLQSLQFMLDAEARPHGLRDALWMPIRDPKQPERPQHYSPVFRALSEGVDRQYGGPAFLPRGGFLADKMGLGKTVVSLALMKANPSPRPARGTLEAQEMAEVAGEEEPEEDAQGRLLGRGTLVVCPVSLVGQWMEEARLRLDEERGGTPLVTVQYHGPGRLRDLRTLADADLVVTTYQTLQSDFSSAGKARGKKGEHPDPLHAIRWHRIILDEGHNIHSPDAAMTKACIALAGDRRWVVTGTPFITGSVDDLIGPMAFLQLRPFEEPHDRTFKDLFHRAFASRNPDKVAARGLQLLLQGLMVRHPKSVLQLPDKTEEVVYLDLSPSERAKYLEVHQAASHEYFKVRALGGKSVSTAALQLLSLLQPLRRICTAGTLAPRDLALPDIHRRLTTLAERAGKDVNELEAMAREEEGRVEAERKRQLREARLRPLREVQELASIPDDAFIPGDKEGDTCPICLDDMTDVHRTPCHHFFCHVCITAHLERRNTCPNCRQLIRGGAACLVRCRKKSEVEAARARIEEMTRQLEEEEARREQAQAQGAQPQPAEEELDEVEAGVALHATSKLEALAADLLALRDCDPTAKTLVFTNFQHTLEHVAAHLGDLGFGVRMFSGGMSLPARSAAIRAFQTSDEVTVMVLSLKAGGVGINLTAASNVILLDPCLNRALEEQAIGRAHRMGAQRDITVKRLIVRGSVEERILQVARERLHGKEQSQVVDKAAHEVVDFRVEEFDTLFRTPELLLPSPTMGPEPVPMMGEAARLD